MALSSSIVTAQRLHRQLNVFRRISSSFRRSVHTSVTMSKEQLEELQRNPYFGKYADKIAKLKQVAPEEFSERVAVADEMKKARAEAAKVNDFSFPTQAKPTLEKGMVKEKKLDDIMKTDLIQDKSASEISELWKEFFMKKDAVSAVIPAETYRNMEKRLNEFTTFLFPLPRKNGYEFVVMQFAGNEAHFTTLINFQAYKENAPECLTLVHYTELASQKGIVLMAGEYDKNVLTIHEAQCLASQVEMYYFKPTAERLKLLQSFHNRPADFKHMDLIKQLETVDLAPQPIK